jgi:hypothetical protein
MIMTDTVKDSPERRKALIEYVEGNSSDLFEEEVTHVAMCLDHLLDWYETGRPPGSFLTNVLKNDFKEACFTADGTNIKAFKVYAFFLHWEIPGDYRLKIKEDFIKWNKY